MECKRTINKPVQMHNALFKNKSKMESWKQYITKININTPIVQDMAKKMNGKITTSKLHLKSQMEGKMYRKGEFCQLVDGRI